ncbi:hypothetical protein [Mesorhizobium wenxiniae]|uniref:hypothetical protein n=1 Tax=Mesorhizobium wenxiniae TaxID=2014805 RepID=UPI001FD994FC|nr:hypothetical protein [Mesorhizobium wenxiniae]
MHDDHHHSGDHGDGHHHHGPNGHHDHPHALGHNGPAGKPLQWQTPHLPPDQAHKPPVDPATVDLDLVETAFLESFARAPDPSSFLRLAGIPFVGDMADGVRQSRSQVHGSRTGPGLTARLRHTDRLFKQLVLHAPNRVLRREQGRNCKN